MCISAALLGGGAVVGGVVQGVMGARGASAAADAARQSGDIQRYMFEQSRADMQPVMDAGNTARNALMFELGVGDRPQGYQGFTSSPGYDFMRGEGQRAIDMSAAARGGLFSGRTARESQRYATGLAAQDYGQYLNRLAAMSGTGQTATGTVGALGSASAANQGNALMQAGNARASGYNAIGNAVTGTLGDLAQGYGYGRGQGWWQ